MKNCEIDSRGAGRFAAALENAARRFCLKHPDEQWQISGVENQEAGISLNARNGGRSLVAKSLVPVLDMEDYIFDELEKFRSTNI
jgi:hypothetical protein